MERGRNQVETSTATPKIVLLFEERCLDNKRSFRNDQQPLPSRATQQQHARRQSRAGCLRQEGCEAQDLQQGHGGNRAVLEDVRIRQVAAHLPLADDFRGLETICDQGFRAA
jgi:hypothetical protein